MSRRRERRGAHLDRVNHDDRRPRRDLEVLKYARENGCPCDQDTRMRLVLDAHYKKAYFKT